MQAEDYYLKPLLQRDNKIAWFKLNQKRIETELKEKDKALKDKDKALKDKDKALKDKDKDLEDKDKALKDKNRVIIEFAKTLKENGVTIDIINIKTGLPIDEIERL